MRRIPLSNHQHGVGLLNKSVWIGELGIRKRSMTLQESV